ncbi:MAG TPA: hypothetical protein VFY29_10715 [Terriglobia bacterium]|nr:hypothetical protein [Terriglobia bacterium]
MIANALKGKIVVFSIFFLGMVAGAFGFYLYETRILENATAAEPADRQQAARRDYKKFHEYLGLTEDQQKQVDEIMHGMGAESRKLFEPIRPKVEALREQSRDEIRAILNEDQRVKYDQWRAERANRSKNRSNP